MKSAILALFLVCTAEAKIKCLQGDGSSEAADCSEDGATKCSSPKFVEYSGFVDDSVAYGCGCTVANAQSCVECVGKEDAACNSVVAVGEDFNCYRYTYDEEAAAWTKSTEVGACKRLAATAVKCNSPVEGAAAADYSSSGCGGCANNDANCQECEGDSCVSGATTITAVVLPLLAALYAFM